MPASLWFTVALVAAVAGTFLLVRSRATASARYRDRRRWARERGWAFVEVEAALSSRWRYGTVYDGGPGLARGLVTGAVPGPDGRRLGHVFDHEQAGQVTAVVAAVQGVSPVPFPVELRVPSAPPREDAHLTPLGAAGQRLGFVAVGGPDEPVPAALVEVADRVGDDVPVLWIEGTWVLAALNTDADADRAERLLTALVAVSLAVEKAVGDCGRDDVTGRGDAARTGVDGTSPRLPPIQ